MLRRIAPLVLVLLPLEAHTSGSSTVRAEGAHLAVSFESPRKSFEESSDEAEWHAGWVRQHQPDVDAALVKLEPALLAAADKTALAPYAEALPEAWGWAPPDHERSPQSVCTSACRVRLQLWGAGDSGVPSMEVSVAFASAPAPGALKAIHKALARSVAE